MKSVKYIVIAVLLLGAGAFFSLNYRQDQKRRLREEATSLEAARHAARQFEQAIQAAAQAAAQAETVAREHIRKSTNAVQAVTGHSFSRRPDRKYLPSSAVRRAAPAPEAKKPDPAAAQAKTKEDDELPPGMLTKEQLERMRAAAMAQRGETPQETKPDAAGPEFKPLPDGPSASPPPPPKPVPKEPDIAILARSVVGEAENVIAKVESIRGVRTSAKVLAEQVAQAAESRAAAQGAGQLKSLHAVTQTMQAEIQESLTTMQEPFQKILEAEQAHAQETARRQAERARILKEEEQRLLVQRELAEIGKAHNRVRAHVKTYLWDAALADLKTAADALQSSEARKAMAVLVERYERMKSLHEFLIRRINAKRFRWGWGQGPAAKDVIAANETVLQLTGQTVPWSEVGLVPMVRILRFYVEDKDLDRNERSEWQLALAIFYLENELNDPAESLAREMFDRYPTLHADISRLLPF